MPSPADIFAIDEAFHKTNHLLVIGIDDYVHCNKLRTAVSDAQAFRDTLLTHYSFQKEHLYELYNEEATRPNIHKMLDGLLDSLTDNDNLIVYYAGHGEFEQERDLGHWVPVEANHKCPWEFISNDDLKSYFKNIKTHHLLVLSDSCFSGSLFAGTRETTYDNRKDSFSSRWAFCSGMQEHVVDDAGGMSPFAKYLIRTLQRAEGTLRASRLVDEVSDQVVESTKQTPTGGPVSDWGDDQGQFIFRPKRDENKDWGLLQEHPSIENCQKFLKIYPEGKYLKKAQQLLTQLKDDKAWEKTQASDTSWAYDQYLEAFPNALHKATALQALEEVSIREAWEEATRINSLAAYRSFLEKYPTSEYVTDIEARRNALKEKSKPTVPPSTPTPPVKPEAGGDKKKTTASPPQTPSGGGKKKSTKDEVITTPPQESKKELIIGYTLMAVVLVGGFIGFNALKNYLFDKGKEIIQEEQLKGQKGVPYNPKQTFTANYKETINDVSIDMVHVHGGTFTMGCNGGQDKDCGLREQPAHTMKVESFFLSKTEITNAQFAIFMQEHGSSLMKDGVKILEEHTHGLMNDTGEWWPLAGFEEYPIIKVTWSGADAYCEWLSRKTGKKYRLPTEAEWEFAARGGNKSKGYKYAGSNNIDEVAWYKENSGKEPQPVGLKKANELGLYDMSGNVWEWCNDVYSHYPGGEKVDNGIIRPGSVIRSGSYYNEGKMSRITYRYHESLSHYSPSIGFRIAVSE